MSNLKKVLSSSFLLSSEAILRKLVGLISTLILARLLVPEDFGLIAIALMVMGLIDAMKQFGGITYLLKIEHITQDIINTSWTINFISNFVLALLLVVAAPYIAEYYSDERLEPVLWAFSAIWIIRNFNNPGLVLLRREQNYLPIVKLSIFTKVIAVIVVVISALIFESYWALVLGQFTTYFLMTIGSHFITSHKQRFCLTNFKEQWSFSGWWTLQSFVGFAKAQLDTFLVSSMFNKSALGSYHTIKYFASMPISFLLEPASSPLLVELRKIKDNKSYFSQQYNVSLIVALILAAPITLFLIQEHYLVTATLLGDNWVEYSGLFAIFCISILAFSFQRQALDVVVILGSAKGIFYFQTISFVVVYGTILCLDVTDVMEFAKVKTWLEASIIAGLFIFITIKFLSFRTLINFLIAFTPIIVSLIPCFYFTPQVNPDYSVFIRLVITAIAFFAIYTVCLVSLTFFLKKYSPEWRYTWKLAGRLIPARFIQKQEG